jgi:hypothetical protein
MEPNWKDFTNPDRCTLCGAPLIPGDMVNKIFMGIFNVYQHKECWIKWRKTFVHPGLNDFKYEIYGIDTRTYNDMTGTKVITPLGENKEANEDD